MTKSNLVAKQLGNPTGLFSKFAGFVWKKKCRAE
jgi:hypothetical protein